MRLTAVIPVGPGHEQIVHKAVASIEAAWNRGHYKFTDLSITPILDTQGALGRCRARNIGIMQATDADWIFLMDADDQMDKDGMGWAMPEDKDALFGEATFQAPKLDHIYKAIERGHTKGHGKTWSSLMNQGSLYTLSMGAFFRASEIRKHLFREDLDYGEDWEFYLSFLSTRGWEKRDEPLVWIGNQIPSAGGPRGKPARQGWHQACAPFIEFWRKRGRVPLTEEERKTEYWK